jgi:23S rRNA (cytidine1920-2'-O)/16S rRNA (cytidine1409-2'-O)-methyltransferase
MALERLDSELVRRGLARSREQAQDLIAEGAIRVSGGVATKPATRVARSAPILVHAQSQTYVSRGAMKCIGALEAFPSLDVTDKEALDVGASTGGFTQVLLERGARHVIALDVGYGQLAWSLRDDPRVSVMERTNMRHTTAQDLPYRPNLIVADVSFISLTTLMPAFVAVAAPDADMLLMVKPQFEVGREHVGHGVVTDPDLRASSVQSVVDAAMALQWHLHGVVASPLPGPKGNVEYFVWLRPETPHAPERNAPDAIARAIAEGPQS